jgi:hypothetical protein
MNINEIINNDQKYLFIRFGESKVNSGVFETEMILGELEQNDKHYSNPIHSLNYFNTISRKIISVWASYQYMGWFRSFDVIKNGKPIFILSGHSNTAQTKFYKKYTWYLSGHEIEELSNLNDPFWSALKNQTFAVVRTPHNGKKYIIPCTEIYRSCFGKYESAIVDATFDGYRLDEIFNPEYTIAGNELRKPIGYIHLRKQFTKKSALFGYRLYNNKDYLNSFANTTADLRTRHEILTKFPVQMFNEVTFNYFEISKDFYLVPRLNGIKIENEITTKIECDTDNSKGKETNEDTKPTPGTETVGINSNPNIDVTTLPTVNGPTDGLLPPVNMENTEEEPDPFAIDVEKVSKEFKKTIRKDAKILIKDPNRKGFSDGSGSDPSTVKMDYTLISTDHFFNSLHELYILLKEEKCFTSVSYYLDLYFHPLVVKDDAQQEKWAYQLTTSDNRYFARNIGIIEIRCDNLHYYLIEIQSKGTESFSMGIINLKNHTALTDAEFKVLRKEIIDNKGVLKGFSKELFKTKYLKHFGERNLNPKDAADVDKPKPRVEKSQDEKNKIMIKNIIDKIKP